MATPLVATATPTHYHQPLNTPRMGLIPSRHVRTPSVSRPNVSRPKSQYLWISSRPPNAPPLDRTDDNDPRLPPRPYPNSYWATGSVLGAEYPAQADENITIARLESLLDAGVVDYIDLTQPGERLPSAQPYLRTLERLGQARGYTVLRMDPNAWLNNTPKVAKPVGNTPTIQRRLSVAGDEHRRRSLSASSLSFTDWQVAPPPKTIRYVQYAIRDTTNPDPTLLQIIMSTMATAHNQKRRMIVHCNGGYGRTGTIIGCWLVYAHYVNDSTEPLPNMYAYSRTPQGQVQLVPVLRQKTAGEHALEWLAKKWRGVDKNWMAPYTPGNQMQMDFVKAYRPPTFIRKEVTR